MLLGSVGQPSTSRYELGSWVCLGYWLCWVCAATPNMAIAESTAMKVAVVRVEIVIANYLLRRQYTPEVLPRSTDCSHRRHVRTKSRAMSMRMAEPVYGLFVATAHPHPEKIKRHILLQ